MTDEAKDARQLRDGGSVVVAMDQEPVGWNPNKPSDYALGVLMQHVLPTPFRVLPDFDVVIDRDLLVSAEQTDDDPQTVVYVIRREASWSDGTPITAADFKYLWEQTVDPNNDVSSTKGYADIESVTGSDDGKTATVVFERPFSDWKSLFGNLLPAHLMETLEGGWNEGLDGENIPTFSGGPFVLKDYRPEQTVKLVANERYWGRKKPKLDQVVIRFGIAADDIAAALENDEIDVAFPQPEPDLLEDVGRLTPDVDYRVGVGLTFEHLDFNLENEFLGERAVRRAISYAIDEQVLVQRTARPLTDDARPLYNRIYAIGQPHYRPHGRDYRGVDVAKAEKVLEGAGYAAGRDGIYSKDGRRLSLRLSTTGGNALREATQSLIEKQLRAAGIDVQTDNEDGTAIFGRIFPDDPAERDFDIALFSWVRPPFASGSEDLYTTGSLANEMRYSNPAVDDLFELARSQLDDGDGAETYNRIDEMLWHDLPTLPLYATPSLLAFRSDLVNVEDNVSTSGPLWNMHEWAFVAD